MEPDAVVCLKSGLIRVPLHFFDQVGLPRAAGQFVKISKFHLKPL